MNTKAFLYMKGITKRFPGSLACNNITFEIQPGEVHTLLGENGAGKTTLMNILYGLYHSQSGEIYFRGHQVSIRSPRDATTLGIGMVHQHFMLIPRFTVTENIILGLPSRKGFLLEKRSAQARIYKLSQKYKLQVDPNAYIWQLSVGQQQRVEIIKALYRGAKTVLILDEPTTSLTPQEVRELFNTICAIKKEGTAVIFISHKLNEVMEISDRITVLRDGCVVGTVPVNDADPVELARMMVGRDMTFQVSHPPTKISKIILEVEDLHVLNDEGVEALRGISLRVHSGEILGIAGVAGNGQRELAEVLTGLRKVISGKVRIKGQEVTDATPAELMRLEVQHIPQDRKHIGSIGVFPLTENAILGSQSNPPFANHGMLRYSVINRYTDHLIKEFDIRTYSHKALAKTLSGGNLQKFVLARSLSRSPKVLIAVQPTAGLDVVATEFIHEQLLIQRTRGVAVLLISMDLDEVLALSDHIIVLYEGRVTGEVTASEAKVEEIGLLMAGVDEHSSNLKSFATGE